MTDNPVHPENIQSLGFNKEEFEDLKRKLGRLPNFLELCLFSELRNTIKSSLKTNELFDLHYSKLEGSKDFPGQSTPGLVKITENHACSITIESAELKEESSPYDNSIHCLVMAGRTVLASGATPVVGLNTVQFGTPQHANTQTIARGLLKGIGEIGNSSGFPIVGAKVSFERCFSEKPELKTMVAGIRMNHEVPDLTKDYSNYKIFLIGRKPQKKNLKDINLSGKEDLKNLKLIQITEEYAGLEEKILIDSTLECIQYQYISAIIPVGRNGIVQAIADLCNQYKLGMNLNIDALTHDKKDGNLLKLLLSHQAAKLLVVARKDQEKLLENVFKKWDVDCVEVGKFTDIHKVIIESKSGGIAEIPLEINNFFKRNDEIINKIKSGYKQEIPVKSNLGKIPLPKDLKEIAWFLIKHPNIASKKWLNEQYDSMAGVSNLSTNFISDAILINLKGTNKALALCMSGNQKHTKASAGIGAQIAVATATRRIVCSGAKPLVLIPSISKVDLNQPEEAMILTEYISGLNAASKKLKIPVISEDINFNDPDEKKDSLVKNCPGLTVGMLGILEDKNHQMTISFKNKGNIIFLIGPSKEDIAASEYLSSYHQKEIEAPPFIDLELENKIQQAIQELIANNYVCSVHNVSRGGLFISLVESAMIYGFGFDIITDTDIRLDAFLFGESQGRVLVSINPNKEGHFIDLMMKKEIPFLALGHVTKGEMRVDDISFGFIEDAKKAYENALGTIIENHDH